MDKLKERLNVGEGWLPLLLAAVCLLAFGLLIPSLGFYWDDWWTLYIADAARSPQALYYFSYRPLHALTDVLTVALLGRAPLYWHILSLVLRFVTVWLFWLVLRRIWPQKTEQTAWAALLFAVYPIFLKQSMAVIFRQHWTSYALFLLSLLFMLRAAREPRNKLWLHALGSVTMLAHLLFTEYFIGLELVRPLVLWLALVEAQDDKKKRLRVLKHWWPYLVLWLGFIVWRLFIVEVLEDPNPPVLIFALLENPISSAFQFAQFAARDLLHVFITSWYPVLQPDLIEFSTPFAWLAWGAAIFTASILALFMRVVHFKKGGENSHSWAIQTVWFGLLATALGLLPTWVTGRDLLGGRYDDRLALPAMFGASLVFVALVHLIIDKAAYRNILFSAMVGLAVGLHLRIANDFRWDWITQNRQLWQLYWRAPDIDDNTPMVANGNFTTYVSRYSASYAINTFYDKQMERDQAPLWYFEYRYDKLHRIVPQYLQGTEISGDLYGTTFSGNSLAGLMVYAAPAAEHCLWLLTPLDADFEILPDEMRQMAQVIDLARISPVPDSDDYPPVNIFFPEPVHTWCYYYQKIELARQQENWVQVLDLWEQAQDGGHTPQHGYEYLGVVLGLMHDGQFSQAVNFSQQAVNRSEPTASLLCQLWAQSAKDFSDQPEFEPAWQEIQESISCVP